MLQSSGIMPIVGELVASRVPEHVRVNRKRQLCGFSSPGDCFQESRGRGGTAALGDEDISRRWILTTQLAQRSDFPATKRMDVVDPAFRSADVQSPAVEFDLIPAEAAYLRGTQPVPVREQDHGGITVPIAGSLAGSFLEPLNLLFEQILPLPKLGIGGPVGNCPVCDG